MQLLAETEVHKQDATVFVAHRVAGFHVAVQQTGGMDRGQRIAESRTDAGYLLDGERSIGLDDVRESAPANIVTPEADAPIAAVHTIDRHDIRVADASDGAGFGDNTGELLVRIETAGQKKFDGDLAFEDRVPRTIHLAETSGSEALQEMKISPIFAVIGRDTCAHGRIDVESCRGVFRRGRGRR